MAEIEEAQSLNTLFFRSKKRTYDMFLTNYGSRLSNDSTSLKLKLACKINDDYAQVKDLPPPAPVRAAPPEQKKEPQTQAQAVSKGKEEEDVAVKGTHAFPSRPGTSLSFCLYQHRVFVVVHVCVCMYRHTFGPTTFVYSSFCRRCAFREQCRERRSHRERIPTTRAIITCI